MIVLWETREKVILVIRWQRAQRSCGRVFVKGEHCELEMKYLAAEISKQNVERAPGYLLSPYSRMQKE